MFGEKPILGTFTGTVDNRTRIVLPTQTYAEEGDDLSLLRKKGNTDGSLEYFEIVRTEDLLAYLDAIKKYEDNSCMYVGDELHREYFNVLVTSILDKEKRFQTYGYLSFGKYKIIGARKSVYIMSEKTYQKQLQL